MSLDIYFYVEGQQGAPGSGIFVREHGQTMQISEAEWYERYPDREPVRVPHAGQAPAYVWRGNVTHNLQRMAKAAGLYEALWTPHEAGYAQAADLLLPLGSGLALLRARPEVFRPLNPANGWGSYEDLVAFVEDTLAACERWPQAQIVVSV